MNNTNLDRALQENEAATRLEIAAQEDQIAEAEKALKDHTASPADRQSALKTWREASARCDDLRTIL